MTDSGYPETIPDLEERIARLRAFEREYRSRLRAYLTSQLGELNGNGDVLDGDQRRQADEARAVLRRWDREKDDPAAALFYERERVLADQVRVLLEVMDEIAPKAA